MLNQDCSLSSTFWEKGFEVDSDLDLGHDLDLADDPNGETQWRRWLVHSVAQDSGPNKLRLGDPHEKETPGWNQSQLQLPSRMASHLAGVGKGTDTLKEIGMGFAGLSNSVTQDGWTTWQSPYQGGRM